MPSENGHRKTTLVLGASINPARASYATLEKLARQGREVIAVGGREGKVAGIPITRERVFVENLDTLTLYLGPGRQKDFYDYIIGLKPRRIIFNPGTENPELVRLAREAGIDVEMACTLVMLSMGTY